MPTPETDAAGLAGAADPQATRGSLPDAAIIERLANAVFKGVTGGAPIGQPAIPTSAPAPWSPPSPPTANAIGQVVPVQPPFGVIDPPASSLPASAPARSFGGASAGSAAPASGAGRARRTARRRADAGDAAARRSDDRDRTRRSAKRRPRRSPPRSITAPRWRRCGPAFPAIIRCRCPNPPRRRAPGARRNRPRPRPLSTFPTSPQRPPRRRRSLRRRRRSRRSSPTPAPARALTPPRSATISRSCRRRCTAAG